MEAYAGEARRRVRLAMVLGLAIAQADARLAMPGNDNVRRLSDLV